MYKVTCSICKKEIGFYGLDNHVKKHKKELGQDCYITLRRNQRRMVKTITPLYANGQTTL